MTEKRTNKLFILAGLAAVAGAIALVACKVRSATTELRDCDFKFAEEE